MKAFTINADNNITVHPSRKAARETGDGAFATEEEFVDLVGPDSKRLVEVWNSLAGVKPVSKFASRQAATQRIWKALQSLGEQAAAPASEPRVDAAKAAPADLPPAEPERVDAETARPLEDVALQAEIEPVALTTPEPIEVAASVANVGAQGPQDAPAEGAATKGAIRVRKAPKTKAAKTEESAGPRKGTKTARVVAMLQRQTGATLEEIMAQMNWQKHTIRGFVAGALKKAGYVVESFKSDTGERSYRINQ